MAKEPYADLAGQFHRLLHQSRHPLTDRIRKALPEVSNRLVALIWLISQAALFRIRQRAAQQGAVPVCPSSQVTKKHVSHTFQRTRPLGA